MLRALLSSVNSLPREARTIKPFHPSIGGGGLQPDSWGEGLHAMSFSDPYERALYFAIGKRLVEQQDGSNQQNAIESACPRKMCKRNAGTIEHDPHAFEDMRRGVDPGHGLKPHGQNFHGIKDAGNGLEQKDQTPGKNFRLLAEPHDQRGRQDPDNPPGNHKIQDEREQPQAHDQHVVVVEQPGADAHHERHAGDLEDAHRDRRREEFGGREWTRKEIHEISRPQFLEKRDRDALLRTKQHVPQDQRAQKERHELWDLRLVFHKIYGDESPDHEV